MYILQKRSFKNNLWEDVKSYHDYEFVLDLCRLYNEKYPDDIYRVIEVYYSV